MTTRSKLSGNLAIFNQLLDKYTTRYVSNNQDFKVHIPKTLDIASGNLSLLAHTTNDGTGHLFPGPRYLLLPDSELSV